MTVFLSTTLPADAGDLVGVGMAKALLGQREYRDDRLLLETARLRSRIRDLETVIARLQIDNDRLRAGRDADLAVPEPVR